MKRKIAAALAVLAAVACMGWRLAGQSESTMGLKDVSLVQHSEHSQPGPTGALAGIRIRLSTSDYDPQLKAAARPVPQVALVEE